MRLFCLALVVLAACSRPPEPAPALPDHRRDGAPIASVALFDAGRFAGDWVQVAQYPGGCPGEKVTLTGGNGGFLATRRCGGQARSEPWVLTAPGRVETPEGSLWILWVDEGYRTAVLGRPDGQIGAIWNREGRIPADRMRAARELLDFNGYDLTALEENRQ